MSKRNDDRKNIVIVGGGQAGSNIARPLSAKLDASKYNLILVTAHPYFVHLVGALRMTASDKDKLEDTALIPYDKLFINGNGTHKVGTVTAIEEEKPGKGGNVILRDGEKIPYDVLVLASGSIWRGPVNFPESDSEIRHFVNDWRKKYADASHIVLVGGGIVSVETAGELKDVYSDKKITIVHSQQLLLNDTYPDRFRRSLESRVRSLGVEVLLNDAVEDVSEGVVTGVKTRNGKDLADADFVVYAVGGRPNTSFISSLDASVLSNQGYVKVKPTLEVVGHAGVFAAGDIIEWKEQKQAAKAQQHAPIVVANVLSYVAGLPQKKLYKGTMEFAAIPLGRTRGTTFVDALWGITLGNSVTKIIKGSHLFVPMTRSAMGLK